LSGGLRNPCTCSVMKILGRVFVATEIKLPELPKVAENPSWSFGGFELAPNLCEEKGWQGAQPIKISMFDGRAQPSPVG
jgi:hypothetical protein